MIWERDKKLHFVAGFVIAFVVGLTFIIKTEFLPLVCALIGIGAGAIIGWAKEYLYDAKRPNKHMVDINDFIATTWGALVGGAALLVLGLVFRE